MNERLGSIESNIGGLRGEMGGLRGEMNANNISLRKDMNIAIAELRRELHTNFRWTMGTIIAMWVTVICAIMFA